MTAQPKCVDPVIPVMDLDSFRHHFMDSPVHHPAGAAPPPAVDDTKPSSALFSHLRQADDDDILNSLDSSLHLDSDQLEAATQILPPNIVSFKESHQGLSSSISFDHLPKTLAAMDNHTGKIAAYHNPRWLRITFNPRYPPSKSS